MGKGGGGVVDEKSPRFTNLMGVIRSSEQRRLPPINSQAWKMNSRGPESDLTLIGIDLTRKFRRLMSEEAFFFSPFHQALPGLRRYAKLCNHYSHCKNTKAMAVLLARSERRRGKSPQRLRSSILVRASSKQPWRPGL